MRFNYILFVLFFVFASIRANAQWKFGIGNSLQLGAVSSVVVGYGEGAYPRSYEYDDEVTLYSFGNRVSVFGEKQYSENWSVQAGFNFTIFRPLAERYQSDFGSRDRYNRGILHLQLPVSLQYHFGGTQPQMISFGIATGIRKYNRPEFLSKADYPYVFDRWKSNTLVFSLSYSKVYTLKDGFELRFTPQCSYDLNYDFYAGLGINVLKNFSR